MKSPVKDAIHTVLHAIHSSGVKLNNSEIAREVDCSPAHVKRVREEWTPHEDETEYEPITMVAREVTFNPFKGKFGIK